MANETNNTQQTDPKEKGLVIDPAKLVSAPRGIKNKLNADEDAWAVSSPPVHDIYCLKPVLAKNGIRFFEAGAKDNYGRILEHPHYSVNIEMRIIAESDPEVHMFPVFQSMTTRLGRGKHISTAAGFIKKLGFKVPAEADDLEIVTLLVEVLRQEKVLFGEVDWRAAFKDYDGTWKNVCSTMSDFPKDPETKAFLHRLRVTNGKGTPEEIQAQLTVAKLYSRKEYKELSESGELAKLRASFGIGHVVNTSQLAEEDEVPASKANGAPSAPAPTGNVVKRSKVEEETVPVSAEKMGLALVEDE